LPFNVFDLQSVPEQTREEEAQRIINAESRKPFDLAGDPLARLALVRIAPEEHLLLLSIHHIIADAWTLKIFFQELAAFYQDPDGAASLPMLEIQYPDFAEWQHQELSGNALAQQVAYWKQQLNGAPVARAVPSDYPRPALSSSQGAQIWRPLPSSLNQSLRDLSRREGATLFMTMLTAFQILLARYSGVDDILVGVPVAGRSLVETEPLIGCFINTLVLRGDLSGNPSFKQVVSRTRAVALAAYTNQELPFEKLVEEIQPERFSNGNPLFGAMFAMNDESHPPLTLEGIKVENMRVEVSDSKFDLALDVTEKPEGLVVSLSYSTELFDPDSIKSILEDYETVLGLMVANPAQSVADLPPLRWMPGIGPQDNAADPEAEEPKPEFLAPRTPIEERLAAIWGEVLGVKRLGVNDNFFALGGHSLLAAQVISRTRNTFSVDLQLRRIFETPTVAGLATAIYEMQTADTEDDELAAMLAELSQLSEEEAQRQFAEDLI
jgi:acyl carrier protein